MKAKNRYYAVARDMAGGAAANVKGWLREFVNIFCNADHMEYTLTKSVDPGTAIANYLGVFQFESIRNCKTSSWGSVGFINKVIQVGRQLPSVESYEIPYGIRGGVSFVIIDQDEPVADQFTEYVRFTLPYTTSSYLYVGKLIRGTSEHYTPLDSAIAVIHTKLRTYGI